MTVLPSNNSGLNPLTMLWYAGMDDYSEETEVSSESEYSSSSNNSVREVKSAVSRGRKWSCDACLAETTPEARRGPFGNGTLCNACGLSWAKLEKDFPNAQECKKCGYSPAYKIGQVGKICRNHAIELITHNMNKK